MSARPLIAAVLVCAGVLAPAAAAGEQSLSPKALYKALLKIPRTPTALPAGYESPALGPHTPSPAAKTHHVIGEVSITLTKTGTDGAEILYIVFPTHADAMADWNQGSRLLPKTRLTPPSTVPKPAVMFNATAHPKNAAGKTIAVGTTTLAYVTGTIIVEVSTSSTSSAKHGDVLGSVGLAAFAAAHLKSVESPAPSAPIA